MGLAKYYEQIRDNFLDNLENFSNKIVESRIVVVLKPQNFIKKDSADVNRTQIESKSQTVLTPRMVITPEKAIIVQKFLYGRLKSYDVEKGFGYIIADGDETKYRVIRSQLRDIKTVQVGDRVQFIVGKTKKIYGRMEHTALQVRKVD